MRCPFCSHVKLLPVVYKHDPCHPLPLLSSNMPTDIQAYVKFAYLGMYITIYYLTKIKKKYTPGPRLVLSLILRKMLLN